jgi:hypothetical protein
LGLTIAGAGATVALGLNAQNNPGPEAVKENCEKGQTDCPEYRQGVRNQTYANVAIGATAVFGIFTITSAILTDWGGKDDAVAYRNGDLSIRPTFAVGDASPIGSALGPGASLGATGTF